jgi:hypothetical protein
MLFITTSLTGYSQVSEDIREIDLIEDVSRYNDKKDHGLGRAFFIKGAVARSVLKLEIKEYRNHFVVSGIHEIDGLNESVDIVLKQCYASTVDGSSITFPGKIDSNKALPHQYLNTQNMEWGIKLLVYPKGKRDMVMVDTDEEVSIIKDYFSNI